MGRRRIALTTMNIEGGEYDLVPTLIDGDVMEGVEPMQIQFHLFGRRGL